MPGPTEVSGDQRTPRAWSRTPPDATASAASVSALRMCSPPLFPLLQHRERKLAGVARDAIPIIVLLNCASAGGAKCRTAIRITEKCPDSGCHGVDILGRNDDTRFSVADRGSHSS